MIDLSKAPAQVRKVVRHYRTMAYWRKQERINPLPLDESFTFDCPVCGHMSRHWSKGNEGLCDCCHWYTGIEGYAPHQPADRVCPSVWRPLWTWPWRAVRLFGRWRAVKRGESVF
jgi:hypothetical protein